MTDDVIWIVTEVEPGISDSGSDSGTSRDGGRTRNPYLEQPSRSGGVQRVPLNAAKLEQGMTEFLGVVGRVFRHAQVRTAELAGMELDEIELSVEINGEGQLSLLGSGGKVGGKGAMTLKFKMAAPKSSPQNLPQSPSA
jgi:hypothetical protein